jgi:hypothetical protein
VVLAGCLIAAMALTATSARGAAQTQTDKELASSVFYDCGTKWWSESLFSTLKGVAPVATNRWPLEGTHDLFATQFRPESRNEEMLRDFEEHVDRGRFLELQTWCAAEPSKTVVGKWIPALASLKYGEDEPTPQDPLWPIARRVSHAMHAPQRAEGIVAVKMEAFAGGLKEGLAQAGKRAEGQKILAELSQRSAEQRKAAPGLDDTETAVYLQYLKDVPEKDLKIFAAFWESDLGQWYVAYQWEAGQRVITRAARAAGLSLGGVAAREILGRPLSPEDLAVTTEKSFGPPAVVKDDEDALLTAYHWCGPRTMIESFAFDVAPPVSTRSGPFMDLGSLFTTNLASTVNHEALLPWFLEHADRQRMRAFQKWCATDAAWRVLRHWPQLPTQKRLADFANVRPEAASERRRKAVERVIAAQRAVDFPHEVSQAVALPFFAELRKGLIAAGIDAKQVSELTGPVENASRLQVTNYYLTQMKESATEDLEAYATFWESDLGRYFTALQWEGLKSLLEAGGRKAGIAMAGPGAEQWNEKRTGRKIK